MLRSIPRFALALLFAAACGGDEHDDHAADEEACEHLAHGPATPVTAASDPAAAPEVSNDHRRYDVALVAVSGGNGGVVRFDVAESTDYAVFLGEDVPLAVSAPGGVEIEIEESAAGSEVCAEVAGRHVVPLGVGTHYLELGPTAVEQVGIVLEELAHEH